MAITNLTGTKWLINENITISNSTSYSLNFISNENSFTSIRMLNNNYIIQYQFVEENNDSPTVTSVQVHFGNNWQNQAYRTIKIISGNDVTNSSFISWLENNAVQILPIEYKTTELELASIADAIRAKSGISTPLVYPSGFIQAIEAIETGQ